MKSERDVATLFTVTARHLRFCRRQIKLSLFTRDAEPTPTGNYEGKYMSYILLSNYYVVRD